MKKAPISMVILNRNDESHLRELLPTLDWAGEIIVADDKSNDESREVARQYGARVIPVTTEKGFAAARNKALRQAKSDWILFIDADERIGKKLREEIIGKIKTSRQLGYYLRRRDYFLGKWLRFGETAQVKLLRLARKDSGQWVRSVHEVWQVKGGVGELNYPLEHYPHATIKQFLEQINRYTEFEADLRVKKGERWNWFNTLAYPMGKFLINYGLRWGWADGFPGLIMAVMMSGHSLIVRVKLYEKSKK